METLFCEDASPVFYNLLDFSIAPPLLYYAYIPVVIATIIFAVVALYADRLSRNSLIFAGLSISLGLWSIVSLLPWIAAPVSLVMYSWQLWDIFNVLTYLLTAYFVFCFVYNKDLSSYIKILGGVLALPVIFLTPTILNIYSFDISSCEGVINNALLWYTYFVDVVVIVFVAGIALHTVLKPQSSRLTVKETLVVTFGALALLLTFLGSSIWGDLVAYEFEIVGPVGAAIFLAAMLYISVTYSAFSLRILATEAFMVSIIAVIGSILFIRTIEYVRFVAAGSLMLVGVLSWWLIRSVRKEVQQRREIESLAQRLKRANRRLKELDQLKSEFVSIASHQLRSPLTSIRGYASMLLEGSYGKISEKAAEAIQRIQDSSHYMALSVEDFLNVSRIESGRMKYEQADFNLKDMASKVTDELRSGALKRGLLMIYKSDCDSKGLVHADIGKTRQVLYNLIDNALKYTQKGSVTVFAHDDVKKKRMYVSVRDTGVGMAANTIEDVFQKFVRARNANKVNVTGTGLGLFVAKQMIQEMGGTVHASSEGEGKGSEFTVELPLVG